MQHIASSPANGKGLDGLHLDHERAQLAGLIKTRGNGHDPAPPTTGDDRAGKSDLDRIIATEVKSPTTGDDRAGKSDLDRIIAAEVKCAPAHVKKAREVVRSGREDLIVGAILGHIAVTAAHCVVKPKSVKTGLRDRKRQLLALLGGAQ